MNIREQLIRDEDRRLKPYLDCCGKYWRECTCVVKGKLTIGVGRNLDDRGITHTESLYLLDNDTSDFRKGLVMALPWTATLDEARFGVLVNMAFNLGLDGLLLFKNMLLCIRLEQWDKAATHLLDSTYAKQVGDRAKRLAEQLRTGV